MQQWWPHQVATTCCQYSIAGLSSLFSNQHTYACVCNFAKPCSMVGTCHCYYWLCALVATRQTLFSIWGHYALGYLRCVSSPFHWPSVEVCTCQASMWLNSISPCFWESWLVLFSPHSLGIVSHLPCREMGFARLLVWVRGLVVSRLNLISQHHYITITTNQ